MSGGDVVVWGNCQAAPLGELLRAPLASAGLRWRPTPPVYLADADQLAEVHRTVRGCRVLITQPVSETYRLAGCASGYLAALLPADARVITLPVAYDLGPFPFQTHGYDGQDGRVDAPLTDYHDLRVVHAALRRLDVEHALADWPATPPDAVRRIAADSHAELRRRERDLDVAVSPLLGRPDAMWTMTHPSNAVLAGIAAAVLDRLGIAARPSPPPVEFLAQRRTPIDAVTVAALGRAGAERAHWVIDGREVPLAEVLAAQLDFYRRRPDVARRTAERSAERMAALGLA